MLPTKRAAFRDLVEVDLKVDDGAVSIACVGIARGFIDDRRNGAFARDVAKSSLQRVLREASRRVSVLIANIGRFDQSGFASAAV